MGSIFLNFKHNSLLVNLFLNSDERRVVRDPRKTSKAGNVACGPEMKIKQKTSLNPKGRTGEMAPKLRVLAATAKHLGSILSTHGATHNHL